MHKHHDDDRRFAQHSLVSLMSTKLLLIFTFEFK